MANPNPPSTFIVLRVPGTMFYFFALIVDQRCWIFYNGLLKVEGTCIYSLEADVS